MEPWMWWLFFIAWPFAGALSFRFAIYATIVNKNDRAMFTVCVVCGWVVFIVCMFVILIFSLLLLIEQLFRLLKKFWKVLEYVGGFKKY